MNPPDTSALPGAMSAFRPMSESAAPAQPAPEAGAVSQPALAPSAEPVLPPGHVLDGRFRIREAMCRSATATLYRGEDVDHNFHPIAIKVPLLKTESNPVTFARFMHEEEIGAQLDHPNLTRVYPPVAHKSRPYVVMELLQGETLAHTMARVRPTPAAEALRIASVICTALQYMHDRGFIHRDLKPQNVMMSDDQTLRLFDFGLASAPLRTRSALAKLTPVFGTPEYMAPEQVANGVLDERTDVYCLGVVLYEMLTGQVPFKRDDQWESAFARMNGDPIAPRKLNPAISPQVEEIVLHALQRRPEDRYPSAAAFKAELATPHQVKVTGYCDRLQAPRWRLSFQGTPVLAGLILGFGVVALLVGVFLLLLLSVKK